MWLNVIGSRRLATEIGLPGWSSFSLVVWNSIEDSDKIRNARRRLGALLGLTKTQFKHATVRESLIIATNHLRFCPACIGMSYHSAIFQVKAISVCPVHGCSLLEKCAHCGNPLFVGMEGWNAKSIFACRWCGQKFGQSDNLLKPPAIGNLSGIEALWRTVAEMPRVEWDKRIEYGPGMEYEDESLLAKLTARMFEDRLRRRSEQTHHFHVKRRRPMNDPLHLPVNERCYLLTAREQRSVALYKSYRRYLEKGIYGAARVARGMLNQMQDGLFEPRYCPFAVAGLRTDGEASAEAYAFGLFRHIVERYGFEGIRSIHARRATWVNPVTQNKCLPNAAVVPRIRWPKGFHCSVGDRQWIEDHFLVESLRCIFKDCLEAGRRIRAENRIELKGILEGLIKQGLQGYGDAAALACFNNAGELEFWSGQFPEHGPVSFSMDDIE